jgi:sugar phosphate isomerase/epimerase
MRIALCNEVIATLPFERQCEFAAALGYDGLEVAPFTLGEDPHRIDAQQRKSIRNAARNAGVTITGLHWLLVKPAGLSITTDDAEARRNTLDVMRRLIGLCADLDGRVLVHGSPGQRRIPDGAGAAAARQRGEAVFAEIAVIERWLPTGLVAHIQINDRNRRGPGQGEDRFVPVFAALKRLRYEGVVAVEPFEYVPDGLSAAARAIGYIRGIFEALQ